MSYGYRRNVLGLRPLGLFLSVLCGLLRLVSPDSTFITSMRLMVVSGFVSSCDIFLLFWMFIVTPEWVQLVADSYAARLIEAVDDLHQDLTKGTGKKPAGKKQPA